jgi:hypothetical protein
LKDVLHIMERIAGASFRSVTDANLLPMEQILAGWLSNHLAKTIMHIAGSAVSATKIHHNRMREARARRDARCSLENRCRDGRRRCERCSLRVYRVQLELDGTLMLSRENIRFLFDMAMLGAQSRGSPDRLPATVVFAVAPMPRRKRRNEPEARP